MGDIAEFRDLVGAIDGAGFARLGDRQRRRDHLVRLVSAIAGERGFKSFGRDLGAVAGKPFKFKAAAKKLRRAAFIGDDVGIPVTEHDAPRRRHLRKRQRIRRGAGRHQKRRHLTLEDFRQPPLDASGPVVVAVAARIAGVGLHDGVENGRRHRRRVVAGKIHCKRHRRMADRQQNLGAASRRAVNPSRKPSRHCSRPLHCRVRRGPLKLRNVAGNPRRPQGSLRRLCSSRRPNPCAWRWEFAMFRIGQHCCPNW